MYGHYLRAVGCRVVTARDGIGAIEKAKKRRPDVIVMDLVMPRMDGLTAMTRLKAADSTRRVPVIAISAVPMSSARLRAAGFDGFLAKPCPPDLLWWEIRALLGDC